MFSTNLYQIILIVLDIGTRLIPHPWNVSPTFSRIMYTGSTLSPIKAFLINTCVLILSDQLIASVYKYPRFGLWTPFSIISSIPIEYVGYRIRTTKIYEFIIFGSIVSSTIFFMLSNFGVWLEGVYGYTILGLGQSYLAGLPFYGWSTLGTCVYSYMIYSIQPKKLSKRKDALLSSDSIDYNYNYETMV